MLPVPLPPRLSSGQSQPSPGLEGSLPASCFRLTTLLRRGLALLLPVVLVVSLSLTGCQASGQPPRSVLLQALALQIELTQGAIAQALDLEAQGLPEVNRVRVEQQQRIAIGEGPGLRLTGRFDWRLPGDPIRVDSPFELFLVRGEKGQTWRLARPVGGVDSVQEWLTDPLPLKGDRPGQTRPSAS